MSESTLISLNEAARRTSLSRTAINKYRSAGQFPRAVVIGPKRIAFVASEVDTWIAERVAKRDQEAA